MDKEPVPGADELRDIHGFIAIEVPDWVWITLVTIVSALLIWWIYKKLTTRNIIPKTIFEITVEKLKALDLNQSSKKFYLEYTEIIRVYLEQRLNMHVLDKTAEEIREILIREPKIQTNNALLLASICARGDLAKFARQEISIDLRAKDIDDTLSIFTSIENAINLELAQTSQGGVAA